MGWHISLGKMLIQNEGVTLVLINGGEEVKGD